MILICGVRRMRCISARLSGRASGSRRAAASICFCVIGRTGLIVLCEILILLTFRCASRRDQTDASPAFGVSDTKHKLLDAPDQDETILAAILTVIEALDGEGVAKN